MKKNILICPLEWGLGHAGRMIPLARKLSEMGHIIYIGSGNEHLSFFKSMVPGISSISFPGFRIRYSRHIPQYLVIFLRTPVLIYHIIREHLLLEKIIQDHKIDIVISDSRIGLWNRRIKTVLVTHMLRIPHPRWLRFLENAGLPITRRVIGKFSHCYIPDLPGDINVSGKLSHNLDLTPNIRYIGILSRFGTPGRKDNEYLKKYFCAVILSGPEPQRSLFGEIMAGLLEKGQGPSVILEAKPGNETLRITKGKITFINHLSDEEMVRLIDESENIVTRSGYTTLMELISMNRTAMVVPTPGQPEQEYLGRIMDEKGWFRCISQKDLNSGTDISLTGYWLPPGLQGESHNLLAAALEDLLE